MRGVTRDSIDVKRIVSIINGYIHTSAKKLFYEENITLIIKADR